MLIAGTFNDVLDAIDVLSLDEQKTLLNVVQHRLVERTRQILLSDIEAARMEFNQGLCQTTSVEALMHEIVS